MRAILAVLFSLLAAPAMAQGLTVPADPIVRGAIEDYLRPGFDAFAVASAQLDSSATALCATPSAASLAAAQGRFKAAALAYGHVEFARLGPLGVADRADRLLFWPDPKGIALRQVQGALASHDPTVLDPVSLQSKSVAMQGLVAAEFLLFGTGSDGLATASSEATFRCGYLQSVASLVAGLGALIDGEWRDNAPSGVVADMLAPKADGKVYRSPTEVVQQIAQVLSVGNDTIRDQRISPIIGAAEGTPKPKAALFWRSGLAAQMLGADFAGLRALFDAATLAGALGKAGSASTSNSIQFEFDTASKASSLITSPIDVAVTDTDQFTQLKELIFVTRSLDTLLGQNLPDALGITSGFSLLDGD